MVLEGLLTERSAVLAWMACVRETMTVMTRRLIKPYVEARFERMSQRWLEEYSAEAHKHDGI
jgi:hypothetical protein